MKHGASATALLRSRLFLRCALVVLGAVIACQPKDPCDPGFEVKVSACIPIGDASDSGVGGVNQCEPGEGSDDTFGQDCQSDGDCACPAPVCLTMGLNYCSQIECMESSEGCPDGYDCVEIPEAFRMDGVSSVCLRQ